MNNKIKANPDERERPNYTWRKHMIVKKSRNLRRTFGGMFWIRGRQTSILGAPHSDLRDDICGQNYFLAIND